MYKSYNILLVLLLYATLAPAQNYINQRYDRQRILMDALSGGCYNLDPSDTVYRIGTLFDFNDDTLRMSAIDTFTSATTEIVYSIHSNASQICHTDGKIAAYFNGRTLWDRYARKIQLDVFGAFQPFPYSSIYGYNSSVILPMPDKKDDYILIGVNDYQYDPIYRTDAPEGLSSVEFGIDSAARLHIGRVEPRLIKDKLPFFGALSACRHANGRDWWVVSPRRFSKAIHTFLLDTSGIRHVDTQMLEDSLLDDTYSPEFSPDGRYYTRVHTYTVSMYEKKCYAQIIPFDRCSGQFGKPITFRIPYLDSASVGQVLFSPNSRYFYVMNSTNVWQGDIEADDVAASLISVLRYDPTLIDNNVFHVFGIGFLAPDGKIYIFDGNNNFRNSVINNPDARGLACDARYAAITKPSCTGMSLGNMPDFNLGPIDGSSCDTLGLDNPLSTHTSDYKKSAPLEIYPNPNSGHFSVNVPSQNGFLAVIDMKGQHVRTISVPRFKMVVDVSLPAGAYIITYYSDDGKIIARGKVAVMGD